MNVTVYEITADQFKMSLTNLKNILLKARQWADAKKVNETTLFGLRLAPDMFPLGKQIQVACDIAKGSFMRLTGQTVPVFEDKEATFEDYIQRIDKTIAVLNSAKPEMYANFEKTKQEFPWNPGMQMNGRDYLVQQALPNFYFHASMAYAILRKNGLELGKGDYLGPINFQKKA